MYCELIRIKFLLLAWFEPGTPRVSIICMSSRFKFLLQYFYLFGSLYYNIAFSSIIYVAKVAVYWKIYVYFHATTLAAKALIYSLLVTMIAETIQSNNS